MDGPSTCRHHTHHEANGVADKLLKRGGGVKKPSGNLFS